MSESRKRENSESLSADEPNAKMQKSSESEKRGKGPKRGVSREWTVRPGISGVVFTTDGRPDRIKLASREAVDLLFAFTEAEYPGVVLRGIPSSSSSISEPKIENNNETEFSEGKNTKQEEEDERKEVGDELEDELAMIRGNQPASSASTSTSNSRNAFRCLRDLAKGYLVVECTLDASSKVDLWRVCAAIHRAWESGARVVRHLRSMLVFSDVVRAKDLAAVSTLAKNNLEHVLPLPPFQNPLKFAIDVKVRCSHAVKDRDVYAAVRSTIHPFHVGVRPDQDPAVSVAVLVLCNFAFWSVQVRSPEDHSPASGTRGFRFHAAARPASPPSVPGGETADVAAVES